MVGLVLICSPSVPRAKAESCPTLKIVFARGSGEERWTNANYLAFKDTIETKLKTVSLDYEFIDLDYPAVGIGLENFGTMLGAYFGAGDSYEFGDSVKHGVQYLDKIVNSTECPSTKYIIGGYSQGAMVVSKALNELNPEKIVYAATFGDPKIYLPEGEGIIPAACKGENLSDYRMYVPDCQAYKGILGGFVPYRPETLINKVGTWCNKRDALCSSHLSISDHVSYVSENLYEDASRVIFDKICQNYGLKNTVSSPHDTAILIDSTGSMSNLIDSYKNEALRLAHETLESGGRVALYDYRDLDDPYQPIQYCDFVTCDFETFKRGLSEINVDGGGDDAESLLSASFHVMSSLEWKKGSTKSLVILTDSNYLAPDRDGMTFDEVVALSKQIDPVNFYIITNDIYADEYELLASATDGKVVTKFDELSLLTNYILERYDSLPKVEETNTIELPKLAINRVKKMGNDVEISFDSSTSRTLVIVNDSIMGETDANNITINGLDVARENNLVLVPLGDDIKGEPVSITLNDVPVYPTVIPKAPNTGKL